jgi:gluconate 2-dehydrogenase gamma chain
MIAELVFFNEAEARDVEALAARIFPGSPDDPGAREAGVLVYIDRAVEGAYRELQHAYRQGLAELERHCRAEAQASFADLGGDRQDALLTELDEIALQLEAGDAPAADPRRIVLAQLYGMVRQHTLEGMLGDPAYGGNRDSAGWRLIGFPGAQWGYSPDQMAPGFDATSIPVKTLADLRAEHSARRSEQAGQRP